MNKHVGVFEGPWVARPCIIIDHEAKQADRASQGAGISRKDKLIYTIECIVSVQLHQAFKVTNIIKYKRAAKPRPIDRGGNK